MPDYETVKEYQILGVTVRSEIVRDEVLTEHNQRSILIRSSCVSDRWGTRNEDHVHGSPLNYAEFGTSLERTRFQAAETLAKIERGEIPEAGHSVLGIELWSPTGKKILANASFNLSISPSLLDPGFIEAFGLEKLAEDTVVFDGVQLVKVPQYKIRIKFGDYDILTTAVPSDHSSPACILGGDFFQKAVRGQEYLVQELLTAQEFRTILNVARSKKVCVLIAGKYGDQRERLDRIKTCLATVNLKGLILDEYHDVEEQTLPEKMVTFASISRFVIVDDIAPSGHIDEIGICKEREFVTAILRLKGRASNAMQAHITLDKSFMREFAYDHDDQLENSILKAIRWAQTEVNERSERLNRLYDWRNPHKILR